MIDFHTHILPETDDGSTSVDESLLMLNALSEQGVNKVIATPHFYANEESTDDFIRRRNSAYDILMKNIHNTAPEIVLGAEVSYYHGISRLQNLNALRVDGTRFLLMEMPFDRWTEYTVKEIIGIASGSKFTLVVAHIEQYLQLQKNEVIDRLHNNGILFQADASFFTRTFQKPKALDMLKKNEIHFIGSDCHNMAKRPPDISGAIMAIKKKFGEAFVRDYINYINKLYKQNQINK